MYLCIVEQLTTEKNQQNIHITSKTNTTMKQLRTMIACAGAAIALCTACNTNTESKLTASGLNPTAFDTTINEKPVKLFTLKNKNGMEACITNFGGRVVSLMVPDRNAQLQDVVLGFDNIRQYADTVNTPSDFGASIGRYANRIKDGKIKIDGTEYQLPRNNFGHCLHGGFSGWQYQVYDAVQENDSTLLLTIVSPDGDNGFPGTVKATVTYIVRNDNSLDISYTGETDKPTVLNMTNHSYFNLNGDPTKSIENHLLYLNAYNYTPTDDTFMTNGKIEWVKDTPLDFSKPKEVGSIVNDFSIPAIKNGNGIDHNWCLESYRDGKGNDKQLAASVYSPLTGIMLEVYTSEPGIQVYTGNFLDGTVKGKHGITYQKHAAICLETQKYPDTPNKSEWPSALLRPGERYTSHCIYKFGVVKE